MTKESLDLIRFLYIFKYVNTFGTRNKEQVGKHRIVPYCESFSYCECGS